ncbi:MAG TPA: hypothetical protein VH575_33045 [Gemmataceae bacterium]|jgi:hypothetical protein
MLHPADNPSLWEAPSPVLLNTWKHHAAALRHEVRKTVQAGASALDELANHLVVIGTELMDLYMGHLSPAEIGSKVLAQLQTEDRVSLPAYRNWLSASGGYGVLTFDEDGSRWVLRMGDETDRYIHVHPARWAPRTCRVRANVLKTAVMVLAHVGVHGGDPMELARVNAVRAAYLGLAPMGRNLSGAEGLGALIELLKNEYSER